MGTAALLADTSRDGCIACRVRVLCHHALQPRPTSPPPPPVAHEWWGVVPTIVDHALRLSQEGYR